MDKIKAEKLRNEILEKVAEYYNLAHTQSSAKQTVPNAQQRINYGGRVFDQEEMLMLVDASLDFWLTEGSYSRKFAQSLADFLSVKHCLLVNSGSSANLLAFMTLTSSLLGERRIKRGDEIITVAAAFPTTVSPIIQYGAIPVFVDVDRQSANIDVKQLKSALSDKSKAIFLAHTLGNPFNLKEVKDFCDRHGLWLIEDNCDSLGSSFAGKICGSWGDLATSSFYPPHHITTGEGGALYTSNDLLHKIALSLRDWGRDCYCSSGNDNACGKRFSGKHGKLPEGYDHKYVYSHFGYNLRMTDLQAAIGYAQMKKIKGFTETRQKNFQRLFEGLKDLPQLQFCQPEPEAQVSWFGFLISLTEKAEFKRNELVLFLEKAGIQTRNLFAGNLIKQPCFTELEKGKDYKVIGNLTNTDYLMNNSFWIGVYPGMKQKQIDYMIEKIREFCRG